MGQNVDTHRKKRTLLGVTRSPMHQRPRKKRSAETPCSEQWALFPTKIKKLLVRYFFMQKSNQENRSKFQLMQKHRRKHKRSCKVSPVFDLFTDQLLPLGQRGGGRIGAGLVCQQGDAAGPVLSLQTESYPHSLFYSSGACM